MRFTILILTTVISLSAYSQTWFRGGIGSGAHFESDLCLQVLPIELLYFNAVAKERTVLLDWETVTEINNDYFVVQRSLNQFDWENIEQIDGAGNSIESLVYSTMDYSPHIGEVSYYRLKQVDFDGNYTYSDIRAVSFLNYGDGVVLFPNPTNHSVTISGTESELFYIQIFNNLGQEVSKRVNVIKSDKNIHIDLSRLDAGIYSIVTKTEVNKLVKY